VPQRKILDIGCAPHLLQKKEDEYGQRQINELTAKENLLGSCSQHMTAIGIRCQTGQGLCDG
jgi:hypothetical protein